MGKKRFKNLEFSLWITLNDTTEGASAAEAEGAFQLGIVLLVKKYLAGSVRAGKCLYVCLWLVGVLLSLGVSLRESTGTTTRPCTILYISASLRSLLRSSNCWQPSSCSIYVTKLPWNFNLNSYIFSCKKMYLKTLSGKWQRFCLSRNVFKRTRNCLFAKPLSMAVYDMDDMAM